MKRAATPRQTRAVERFDREADVVVIGFGSTGAVLRFQDTKGRLVAVRLRPQQLQPLASGVLWLDGGA